MDISDINKDQECKLTAGFDLYMHARVASEVSVAQLKEQSLPRLARTTRFVRYVRMDFSGRRTK
jgi:hypothetical protein